jgi:hypothetical protein
MHDIQALQIGQISIWTMPTSASCFKWPLLSHQAIVSQAYLIVELLDDTALNTFVSRCLVGIALPTHMRALAGGHSSAPAPPPRAQQLEPLSKHSLHRRIGTGPHALRESPAAACSWTTLYSQTI